MTTAMNEPAYLGEKAPFLNFRTVGAVIRKDMRTLWPLAAVVAGLTLLMTAYLHERTELPTFMVRLGGDYDFDARPVLMFVLSTIEVVGVGLFLVMLAQQDKAISVRNDWMARPIKSGELVLAKSLSAFAVVVAPAIVGGVITAVENVDVALINVFMALLACSLFLTLGWLCSGVIQAVLATIGMVVLTVLMVSLSAGVTEVRQTMERARPAPAGFVDVERPTFAAPPTAAATVAIEQPTQVRDNDEDFWKAAVPMMSVVLAIVLGGAGVTLWLLLGRRRVTTARLAFVSLYALGVLGLTQSLFKVEVRPAPAATLEQRMAAFRKQDVNGDLKLDRAEYDRVLTDLGFGGQLETYWPQRDVNQDGFIDSGEMQRDLGVLLPAATLQQRMNAFTQNDADKDGKLTKEEYAAALRVLGYSNQLEEYWLERDVNKDGFISVEEYVPAIGAERRP